MANLPIDLTQSTGHHVHLELTIVSIPLPDDNCFGIATERDKVGVVNGQFRGNTFLSTVRWAHGAVGEYQGVRGLNGRLTGTCYAVNDPSYQAVWHSDQPVVGNF
jgi:hypothetical protein